MADHYGFTYFTTELREEGILWVAINRPERRNAITPEMHAEIAPLFRRISEDRTVRVVVLTGAGEKAFCDGADFGGMRGPLEDLVVELGLTGRVRFWGAASREDLERLLERAHLFVSASSYEGFGLSTIEAMSSGTVVLVTSVGAHPSVIQHGVSGFLMDQDARPASPGI